MRIQSSRSSTVKKSTGTVIEQGYAKELNAKEADAKTDRTWYLPHFGVFNSNKPGKLRLVFDAAARTDGTSLNDALLKGPDLLNPLPALLFKFRQDQIAFTADIKEMFHQVMIKDEDRASQRFLCQACLEINHPAHFANGGDDVRSSMLFQLGAVRKE